MEKAKKFTYCKVFDGSPKLDDFKLEEEELPKLKHGEVLLEALYISVDPYMRILMPQYPLGSTMIGSQVARVIKTKNKKYPIGTVLVSYHGWRTHTVANPDLPSADPNLFKPMPVPDLGDLPASLALGAVGMPGIAAQFGFLEICQPKQGETVVVSGAAGAVGSLVGQIAKIKGCKVVGFAGSDEKVKFLVDDIGFDIALNYKTCDIVESLKKAAPKGIDCYFDNVGGSLSHTVMEQMNDFGRVACCGAISNYNKAVSVPPCQPLVIMKQLKIEGFMTFNRQIWHEKWMEGLNQMVKWIKEGKLKYKETVVEGFENIPSAFIGMMKGDNTGKMMVKV